MPFSLGRLREDCEDAALAVEYAREWWTWRNDDARELLDDKLDALKGSHEARNVYHRSDLRRGEFGRKHPHLAAPLSAFDDAVIGFFTPWWKAIHPHPSAPELDPLALEAAAAGLERAAETLRAALAVKPATTPTGPATTPFDPTDEAAFARELRKGPPRLPRARPMQARLVEFMIGKDSAKVEDVGEFVHDDEEVSDRTAGKNAGATSDSAATLGYRLAYTVQGGIVFKDVSPE